MIRSIELRTPTPPSCLAQIAKVESGKIESERLEIYNSI